MAKRKTSCGNARMYSMLLTNVTRSASYEALPNHWLFPARSGLTSRCPLRKRCLWENADAPEQRQKRGCCGSTALAIVVARRSWREISLWKTGDRHRKKKGAHKRAAQGLLVKGDSSLSLNSLPLRFSAAGRTCDGRGVWHKG